MATPVQDWLIRHREDVRKQIEVARSALAELEADLAETESIIHRQGYANGHSLEVVEGELESSSSNALTIKEMALEVLAKNAGGMTNGQVLDAIREQFDRDVNESSLPPQLMRLMKRGQVTKEGKVWRVAVQ